MDYRLAKAMEYDQLRGAFREFLFSSGKKENTVNTMSNQVFFLWRKCGKEIFWQAVQAKEEDRKEMLLQAIYQFSTPKLAEYINGYMTCFRRFLDFLEMPYQERPKTTEEKREKPAVKIVHYPVKEVLTLNAQGIEQIHQKVLESPDYGTDYELLRNAFRMFPLNQVPEVIAMKIALVDMTNSTHLGVHRSKVSTNDLVQLILNTPDFDERIRQGDPDLVNLLAKNTGRVNLFSFATKYCTYHNVNVYERDDYSIFDSVVAKTLPRYAISTKESQINKWRKTYNYKAYSDCITEILDRNDIHIPFRRRKFDHYIWYINR